MNANWCGELLVAADHPALSGHFPGNPMVPGVVLLDAVLAAIRERLPCVLRSMPHVKFLQPLPPGERVELRVELRDESGNGALRARFSALRDQIPVLEGTFLLAADPEVRT
jgi:3-hydroxyacyl-[acyl-carrier-protein] dehydratase